MAPVVKLPRKEAVRAVLNVIDLFRKDFKTDIRGRHRELATAIVDECEKLTKESPYKTRFLVNAKYVVAFVGRDMVAKIDLDQVKGVCCAVAIGNPVGDWYHQVMGNYWRRVRV